jgi:hypothetical protein
VICSNEDTFAGFQVSAAVGEAGSEKEKRYIKMAD